MIKSEENLIAIHGAALIDRALVHDAVVIVRDCLVDQVGRAGETSIPKGADRIDSEDQFLVPGLIDIHIHGSGG